MKLISQEPNLIFFSKKKEKKKFPESHNYLVRIISQSDTDEDSSKCNFLINSSNPINLADHYHLNILMNFHDKSD